MIQSGKREKICPCIELPVFFSQEVFSSVTKFNPSRRSRKILKECQVFLNGVDKEKFLWGEIFCNVRKLVLFLDHSLKSREIFNGTRKFLLL